MLRRSRFSQSCDHQIPGIPKTLAMPAPRPWIIPGGWTVCGHLGSGSASVVYKAIHIHTKDNVAVKIGTGEEGFSQILNEGMIYAVLRSRFPSHLGFARIYECRSNAQTSALIVMERLGSNLEDLLHEHIDGPHGMFPRNDLLEIGVQIVKHLRDLHTTGYIHRDILPENIIIGKGNTIHAYLIDFGVARNYLDGRRNYRIYGSDRNLPTNSFSSLALHQGHEAGRRDDLESLGYCLVYLFNGTLPWLEDAKQKTGSSLTLFLRAAVSSVRLSKLCDGMGVWMQRYMDYLRGLEFKAEPDYAYLVRCLSGAKSH